VEPDGDGDVMAEWGKRSIVDGGNGFKFIGLATSIRNDAGLDADRILGVSGELCRVAIFSYYNVL